MHHDSPFHDPHSPMVKVLLIEDNPADARLIKEMLSKAKHGSFVLEYAETLSAGHKRLAEGEVDVIIIDLMLPDSEGLDTFENVKASEPNIPIIILTGLDDEGLAIHVVQHGAQDYLVKNQVDSNLLTRSIYYAIERKKLEEQLKAAAITDDLTGLFNRRGFFTLAEQQCKLAFRTKSNMYLLYLDLNNMKQINDEFGHKAGDEALQDTAKILRKTFRESDIIARLGGDEFAVFMTEPSSGIEDISMNHLLDNFKDHNKRSSRSYNLSVSKGMAYYDPHHPSSLGDLVSFADEQMYEDKRRNLEEEILSTIKGKKPERRRHRRLKVNDTCHAKLDTPGDVIIKDISLGGICLKTPQQLTTNKYLIINLSCEKEKAKLKSVLIRASSLNDGADNEGTSNNYEAGLKFIGLSDSDKNHLQSIISNLSD